MGQVFLKETRMLIRQPPLITEVTHNTCSFHQRNPGKPYAGCTCSGSYSAKVKPMKDWTPQERAAYFGLPV